MINVRCRIQRRITSTEGVPRVQHGTGNPRCGRWSRQHHTLHPLRNAPALRTARCLRHRQGHGRGHRRRSRSSPPVRRPLPDRYRRCRAVGLRRDQQPAVHEVGRRSLERRRQGCRPREGTRKERHRRRLLRIPLRLVPPPPARPPRRIPDPGVPGGPRLGWLRRHTRRYDPRMARLRELHVARGLLLPARDGGLQRLQEAEHRPVGRHGRHPVTAHPQLHRSEQRFLVR